VTENDPPSDGEGFQRLELRLTKWLQRRTEWLARLPIFLKLVLFSLIVVVPTLVILYLIDHPPEIPPGSEKDFSQNASILIGTVIGAATTAIFFGWIQVGQDNLKAKQEQNERQIFLRNSHTIFSDAYKLGHQVAVIYFDSKDIRRERAEWNIKHLCDALGIRGDWVDVKGSLHEVFESGLRKSVLSQAIANRHGSDVIDIFNLGFELYREMFKIKTSEILDDGKSEIHDKIDKSLKAIYADSRIRDYCKAFAVKGLSNEKIEEGRESVLLYLELVDYYFRFQGLQEKANENLKDFLVNKKIAPEKEQFIDGASRVVIPCKNLAEHSDYLALGQEKLLNAITLNDGVNQHLTAALAVYEECLNIVKRNDEELRRLKLDDEELKLDNYDALIGMATALSMLGRDLEALEFFEQAYIKKKDDERIWNGMGMSLANLGNIPAAIVCYDEAVRLNPDYVSALRNLGLGYREQKSYCEALVRFEEAVDKKNNYLDGLLDKTYALYKIGFEKQKQDPKSARDIYFLALKTCDKAIAINRDSAPAWYHEAIIYEALEDYKSADICYDRSVKIEPHNVLYLNAKGICKSQIGQHEVAMACFDKIIEIDENYPGVWIHKGLTHYALAEDDDALRCFERVIEKNPIDINDWVMASSSEEVGKLHSKIASCYKKVISSKEAISRDPGYADAYLNQGIFEAAVKNYADAVVSFDKVLELNPENIDALVCKGRVWILHGYNLAKAVECFDEAISKNSEIEKVVSPFEKAIAIDMASHPNPKHGDVWYMMGRGHHWGLLTDLNRHEKAASCYEDSVKKNPDNASAWYYWGIALAALVERDKDNGGYKKAIDCFDKAIEKSKKLAEHQKYLASIDKTLRGGARTAEYNGTQGGFAAVILGSDPLRNYGDACRMKALACYIISENKKAIASCDESIAINPNNADAWYYKGLACFELEDYAESVACFDKVIILNPNYRDVCNDRRKSLEALETRGRQGPIARRPWADAVMAAYKKAIELKPDDADAHYNLGVNLSALGNKEEAVAAFKKAIELKPDDADAHYNLGVNLSALGNKEEAVAAYKKAIELKPDDADAH
jgi:tetratricopeptide (TPR) repeat protein